ncbi:aldehyde dehydrogenase family protein [Streptosporangium amethystogenes subsp. fukuiense]|uniref:Aldehyde dehydrogenase family protein n=1 Tax=Streptosporangium amethystogenes subsp. fukuiense TaxID=698418 RepID=A0ABW2T0W1_9ACTN
MAATPDTEAQQKPIEHTLLFIDGKWEESEAGGRIPVVNPATGEVFVSVQEARESDVDRAVLAARKAFDSGPWPRMKPGERAQILWRLGDLIQRDGEELARLTTLENGKPYAQSQMIDVRGSVKAFHYFSGWATKVTGATIPLSTPGDYHAFTQREALGVCALIVPWNYPLSNAAWKVGPALAAGNTCVLKPAEATPLSALRLARLAIEAGLPEGVLNVVPGYGPSAGAALAEHPLVDKVSFTGSTQTGRAIATASLGNFKRVTLELGGKSPNIVFADADLEAASAGAAAAIFSNMGEQCVAGSRLYVEESVFDEVVARVAAIGASMRIGDGFDPETQIGPLVSKEHLERVTGYLRSGVEQGATVLSGGETVGDRGFYLQPTVFTDVTPDMRIVREEIFGPVVVATPFREVDDLVDVANDSPYGLAAGVWTQNISRAHSMSRALRAGVVWVNCYGVFDPALPFGGFKESGWGREMGYDVMQHYTENKSTVIKLG